MKRRNGSPLTTVILAAGRGFRLGRASDRQPKCLVQIDQLPLLQVQFGILAAAGIEDIVVVAGYRGEQVLQCADGKATVIFNEHWAASNSLYSLSLTRERVTGELLVLNGDVLVHPDALTRLLRSGGDAFLYDSSSGTDEEHMKVKMDGDTLRKMSKELPAECSDGENLGLLYFTAPTAALLFDEVQTIIDGGGRSAWAPAAVERTARKVPLRGIDVSDLSWIEIDYPEDLDRARRHVWPSLRPALQVTDMVFGPDLTDNVQLDGAVANNRNR